MSILRNLAKIKEARKKRKEDAPSVDLTLSETGEKEDEITQASKLSNHFETSLGELDFQTVKEATVKKDINNKRGNYQAG